MKCRHLFMLLNMCLHCGRNGANQLLIGITNYWYPIYYVHEHIYMGRSLQKIIFTIDHFIPALVGVLHFNIVRPNSILSCYDFLPMRLVQRQRWCATGGGYSCIRWLTAVALWSWSIRRNLSLNTLIPLLIILTIRIGILIIFVHKKAC